MVTIDIVMIAMACGLCALCFFRRKSIRDAGANVGVAFLFAGIIPVTVLYVADFYTMTLLPLRVGMAAAMEAMAALHMRYSWYAYLFALFATMCGIYLCIRAYTGQLLRQEEALRAAEGSEARLANAQRMAHLGSWEMEYEAGKATWSAESYRIFGYQPGEIEPNFNLLRTAIHPADWGAFVEKWWRAGPRSPPLREEIFVEPTTDGCKPECTGKCRTPL